MIVDRLNPIDLAEKRWVGGRLGQGRKWQTEKPATNRGFFSWGAWYQSFEEDHPQITQTLKKMLLTFRIF
jgi:hypothetical protein